MATKKKYKGKYPGPDIFKGDSKLNADYKKQTAGKNLSEAAKRALASKIYSGSKKPASTTKPTTITKPAAGTVKQPTAPNVYPTSNATSNASGNIQLQSNHELNMQELDARQAYDEEMAAASLAEQQALIADAQNRYSFGEQRKQDYGALNANMAARGLSGGAYTQKKIDLMRGHNEQQTNLDSAANLATNTANAARTSAAARRNQRLQQITLGRQEYTNQQSRTAPTAGSRPENSGVKAIKPAPLVKSKTTTAPKASTTAKSYKGKYYGPDIFKGDKKLNTAYESAIKGKKLSDAAKRQIANQIYSKR